MRNDLPENCFATLPGTGNLIIIKRGEAGYYRSDWDTGDKAQNQEIADFHNRQRGITPAQVEAMEFGSMFGFDLPGANPQVYYDEARFVCSSVCRADSHAPGLHMTLKDPADSCCYPIEGNLHLYVVAGKESLYLDVFSMPGAMMGMKSNHIILPDLVAGKPLVPVAQFDFDTETRTRIMRLESGSYSHGKEINSDYQIVAKVKVGPVEYALGELDSKYPSFVTWERTPANDGDGPPNYYWGHYFDNRDNAVRDFCDRAKEKFKMLSHERKPSIKAQLATKPTPSDRPDKPKDKGAR